MFLQNNSTTICNIQLFAEDWISQSASVVSYCIGFIGSIIWTKKSLQEICDSSQNWTIFSIFRTWIKALVSKALYYLYSKFPWKLNVKRYEILFYNQISIFVFTSVGLDLSLIWINYSPEFCLYKTFLKSSLPVIAGISISFSTVLKFYVLCFKKSMLEINDKKVSIF